MTQRGTETETQRDRDRGAVFCGERLSTPSAFYSCFKRYLHGLQCDSLAPHTNTHLEIKVHGRQGAVFYFWLIQIASDA